jgi:hypothetical protein
VKPFTIGIPGGSFVRYEWGSAGDPPVVYRDGHGGCGLHANEIAPRSLRVVGGFVTAHR